MSRRFATAVYSVTALAVPPAQGIIAATCIEEQHAAARSGLTALMRLLTAVRHALQIGARPPSATERLEQRDHTEITVGPRLALCGCRKVLELGGFRCRVADLAVQRITWNACDRRATCS
jgi:spermidine synthase